MAGKKGMNRYSIEIKLKAIEMFFKDEKTQGQIAQELGLPRKDLVADWVHLYRYEGEDGLKKARGRPRASKSSEKAYIARLEMENALLKKLHTELRKSVLARRDIGSLKPTEDCTQ